VNELEKWRAEAERQPEAELGQPLGALQRYRQASRPWISLGIPIFSAMMLFLV
jgi:hypothetical protein